MVKGLVILCLMIFLLSNIYAQCNSTQININSASAEELDRIIWIGNSTANKIISYRQTNIFNSLDELINISGIGETKLADIKSEGLACVDEETEEQEEEPEENEEESQETESSENESGEEEEDFENDKKDLQEEISDNLSKNNTEIIPIILNAKTIKSEDNKENLKEDLAFYGIIAFCSVFGALLLLKKRKYKNEFQ